VSPLNASTALAAVIGHPVRHSLSPALHNAAYAACGLDWAYLAFEVAEGRAPAALEAMRTLGLRGLSVTMPHKDAVAACVDDLSDSARRLGAVNCVGWHGDRLVGHNTDGDGLVDALAADAGLAPAGLDTVVLGAGGAARSIIEALARRGARSVTVINRDPLRAEVAARLAGPAGRVGQLDDLGRADLVVNATSVGMGTDELPADPSRLHGAQVVVDVVYHPLETAWLREAAARGARTVDGLAMLVHQAARQFTLWTSLAAPVVDMVSAARAELDRRR
jgi:shikimate dehydrogenase